MLNTALSVTEPHPSHVDTTYQTVSQGQKPRLNDVMTLTVCAQLQIRYACGHSAGGEFVKCQRHMRKEDERCISRHIRHIDAKQSTHKCRLCLRSE
ncbi:unnamed protein product [Penicillium discolor]